jgi:L-cystine uptake protein TcyP (sodium:dicarboxylate symporter family)
MFWLLEINWSNISGNWAEFISTGYTNVLGVWFYPIIFFGLVGYVYTVNRSAYSAAALLCIIFVVFSATGVFANVDTFSQVASGLATIAFAGGFVLLFAIKRFG